jgi:hypothetical protein
MPRRSWRRGGLARARGPDQRSDAGWSNLLEATARLRAHPWFGRASGGAGLSLALWLRPEMGDGPAGCPFTTFFPVVVLTASFGGMSVAAGRGTTTRVIPAA